MSAHGLSKAAGSKYTLSIRASSAVRIVSKGAIPPEYTTTKTEITVNKKAIAAAIKAGITRRLRPYDLRHAFATFALDAGADIKAVAEMMNHSNPSMILRHYQHTKEATKRSIIDSCLVCPACVSKKRGVRQLCLTPCFSGGDDRD